MTRTRWPRRLPPAPVEPPAWVRHFTPEDWAEPDDYELQMTAGLADHGLTPRLAEARRWHAQRRWCEAMNAWYRAHPRPIGGSRSCWSGGPNAWPRGSLRRMTTSQTTSQTALLAALLGGSLAMIGGLLSGWLNNWLGEKRDQRRYKQEQDMALEARRQERLQQAYIELLRYLSPYADWAKSAQRLLGKPPAIPDLPPGEELKLVEALVEAYGSPEVRQLLREWRKHAAKLQYADEGLQPVGFDDEADADDEAWTPHMAAHRKATLKADQAIRDRIRQELAGKA